MAAPFDPTVKKRRSRVIQPASWFIYIDRDDAGAEPTLQGLKLAYEKICKDFKVVLLAVDAEPDHVRLLIAAPSQTPMAELEHALKAA